MRALRLVGRGKVTVDDAPVPTPVDGEILIRTSHAAVCGSDLHTIFHSEYTGPVRAGYPGHESVGQVIESRSSRFVPDDLVLAVPDITCFASFADYQVVPERFLLRLPAGDPALLLMAQQMGTVEFALKHFLRGAPRNDTALIIGCGPAGLHFVALLKRRGYSHIVCSDVDDARLRAARSMGATTTVNANESLASDVVLDKTGGAGADLVVEAVGSDSTRADAVRAVADQGDLGFFGLPERGGLADFPFEALFRKRATVHTSNLAQREPGLKSFDTALSLITGGEVDVRPMLGTPYSAESVVEAVEAAENHTADSAKIVIDFRSGRATP